MTGQDFADLLRGDAIVMDAEVADKPALLALLAERAAPLAGVPAALILERVREREALGATGFGLGAAIPHARLPGLERVTLLVARLARGIDYGAIDGEPVDLIVLLLSPETAGADHLKALARVSRTLRSPAVLAAMRAAPDAEALFAAIGRAAPDRSQAA